MSKPDKKTIRAWIDNSSLAEVLIETSKELYPAQPLTEFVVENCIRASDLIEELEDAISDLYDEALEAGEKKGFKEGEDSCIYEYMVDDLSELPESAKEEIGLQFALATVQGLPDARGLPE